MSEPQRQVLERIADKFPLMKLPYLPVKDTVNLMNAVDIYQLSLASKRKRALIKFMNFKTEGLLVKLYHQRSAIHFWKDDMYSLTPAQAFYSKEADFQPIWQPENKTLVSDHSAECLTMATRLSSLFRLKSCIYWLIDLKKTAKEMNQILSRVISESCTEISIMEHQWINGIPSQALIDEEVLEYLMNNAKLDTIIRIFALFPDNFKHENLFKFRKVCYTNASWVTMETLKSFRGVGSVTLWSVNFNSKDINEFVTYWINSDEDMMEDIEIYIKDENDFLKDEVLNQLITVSVIEKVNDLPIHLVKVRNTKKRKRIIGTISFFEHHKGITLKSLEANEKYTVHLQILEVLEKEKELESTLAEIEKEVERIEDGSMIDSHNLDELMERKEAVELELSEIRMQLLNLKD